MISEKYKGKHKHDDESAEKTKNTKPPASSCSRLRKAPLPSTRTIPTTMAE